MEMFWDVWLSFIVVYVGLCAVGLALYVIMSMGLYTIAERRGIPNPWLAWLPVGNVWILGAIADHYRTATRGEKQNRRMAILILSIAVVVVAVVGVGFTLGSFIQLMIQAESGMWENEFDYIRQFFSIYFSLLGVMILSYTASLSLLVLQYMCLYDLFASCDPDKRTVYLALSLIVFLVPVFVFLCRKKDLGMFPRPAPQYYPYGQPMYQQPVYPQPVCPPTRVFTPPVASEPTTEETE